MKAELFTTARAFDRQERLPRKMLAKKLMSWNINMANNQ